MNTQLITTRKGLSAIVAGALILLAPLGADAANRPSPDTGTEPTARVVAVDSPTRFSYPCPAADAIPLCNLYRTQPSQHPGNPKPRVTTSAGGETVSSPNTGRVRPSPY